MKEDKDWRDWLAKLLIWFAFTFGFCVVISVLSIFFWEIILNSDEVPYKKVFRTSFFIIGLFFAYLIMKNNEK